MMHSRVQHLLQITSKALKEGLDRMTDTSSKWELKIKPSGWHSEQKIKEYKEEYYGHLVECHILNNIRGRLQDRYVDKIKAYFMFFSRQQIKKEGYLKDSNVSPGSLLELAE